MAFKIIVLFTLLAVASAGYLAPVSSKHYAGPAVISKIANPAVDAVATTQQNVLRSWDGTVSQYSKIVQTPYSSVHKEDARVSNNVYKPAVAKTVTYTAPALAQTISYAPASTTPVYTTHYAPVVTKAVYEHLEPAHAVYAPSLPHTAYTHEQPAHTVYVAPAPTPAVHTHHHEVPLTVTNTYNHGSAATTYSHSSPSVSAYGSSQTVHYSPAEMVSHMSFDGFGTHWGF